MRKINKSNEPAGLTRWKRDYPKGRYAETDPAVRQEIRAASVREQYYLCAYCCQRITDSSCHNEHIEAQDIAPNKTLDFDNIVASCNTKNQCGHKHGNKELSLTPLMDECETELQFYISGEVKGLTARAEQAIDILNLGGANSENRRLIEQRKQLAEGLLWTNGADPRWQFMLEDEELTRLLIEDCLIPKDGKMDAFAPVLKNIMSAWLAACRT